MPNPYDIAYASLLTAAAPIWLLLPKHRRRILKALREQMGRDLPFRAGAEPAVMIHAVSAGEMNATPALATLLRQSRPDLHLIITATSDAGMAAARRHYETWPNLTLVRYPLDFSQPVQRLLDRLRPDLVVLMELEVWPNFLKQCSNRQIPVVVAQARLTEVSFRNYRFAGPAVRAMFRRLAFVCAQEQSYADRFTALGVPTEKLRVTGTMKFDTSGGEVPNLSAALGLHAGTDPLWVCGSTGEGEEEIILRVYRQLQARHPDLRLLIVPRHPPRFDAVAELIRAAGFPLYRRSSGGSPSTDSKPILLGDTMGELRSFYALADVVFVGRTLVDLGHRQHGSDMIEPAALGKPIVIGPFTGNFSEPMNCFRAAEALLEVSTEAGLLLAVEKLLLDCAAAKAMGERARQVVERERGATARNAEIILKLLNPSPSPPGRGPG